MFRNFAAMTDQKKHFTIYAESTPNPATMKFVANHLLVEADRGFEFFTGEDAVEAPLISRLFRFAFVESVFVKHNFITITKLEKIEWYDVVNQIREFIQDNLNAGMAIVNNHTENEEVTVVNQNSLTEHATPKNDVEKNIVAILDEYVKPAVENDGGNILFESYDEGTVNLVLKGSCSGCPSSTVTLKSGVEGLLKQMMPEDVKDVVAVEG